MRKYAQGECCVCVSVYMCGGWTEGSFLSVRTMLEAIQSHFYCRHFASPIPFLHCFHFVQYVLVGMRNLCHQCAHWNVLVHAKSPCSFGLGGKSHVWLWQKPDGSRRQPPWRKICFKFSFCLWGEKEKCFTVTLGRLFYKLGVLFFFNRINEIIFCSKPRTMRENETGDTGWDVVWWIMWNH